MLDYAGGGSFANEAGDAVGRYHYLPDTLTITGIAGVSADGIKLYPNPTTGECNVSISSALSDDGTLYITDLTGRMVKTITLSDDETSFPTNDMGTGIYICAISYGGKTISTKKLMVE